MRKVFEIERKDRQLYALVGRELGAYAQCVLPKENYSKGDFVVLRGRITAYSDCIAQAVFEVVTSPEHYRDVTFDDRGCTKVGLTLIAVSPSVVYWKGEVKKNQENQREKQRPWWKFLLGKK